MERIPLIDITDLYHPHQDVGDNVDLILPYALREEIDLRAVILDCTERFRSAKADDPNPDYRDPHGPRDPGFIPVHQLNYLFNRNIPAACGPFSVLKSEEDTCEDLPLFQQQGIELILKVLRESATPVEVCIFSSCRSLAAAYNRDPNLLHKKIKRVSISAGTFPPGYLEWNVMLDPIAFVRLFRSGLPIDLYPCATPLGPFDVGRHNSFWRFPNIQWMGEMEPRLRRYLAFAVQRVKRVDYLRAMDEDWDEIFSEGAWRGIYAEHHNVWETAVWMEITQRALVQRESGEYHLVKRSDRLASDRVLPMEMKNFKGTIDDSGTIQGEMTAAPSPIRLFDRGESPEENQKGLCEAFPRFYKTFTTSCR